MMKSAQKADRFVVGSRFGRFCRAAVVAIFLCGLGFLMYGCKASSFSQPGETVAEGRRRHHRIDEIRQQQLMQDFDTFWLSDKPSRLTSKRMP